MWAEVWRGGCGCPKGLRRRHLHPQLLPFTQLEMLPYASDSLNTFPVGAEREAAAAALIETMVADADALGAPLIGWVPSPVPNMGDLCLTERSCLCVVWCASCVVYVVRV